MAKFFCDDIIVKAVYWQGIKIHSFVAGMINQTSVIQNIEKSRQGQACLIKLALHIFTGGKHCLLLFFRLGVLTLEYCATLKL